MLKADCFIKIILCSIDYLINQLIRNTVKTGKKMPFLRAKVKKSEGYFFIL